MKAGTEQDIYVGAVAWYTEALPWDMRQRVTAQRSALRGQDFSDTSPKLRRTDMEQRSATMLGADLQPSGVVHMESPMHMCLSGQEGSSGKDCHEAYPHIERKV